MTIGIMQPYFFPYLGYFSLIKHSDRFVFFDTPQYISHGWVNRNRTLRQDGTPGYIVVPIQKAPRETVIKDIRISDEKWQDKIYGQLAAYKKRAPHYGETLELLHSILDSDYGGSLSELNIAATAAVCAELGVERPFDTFSRMDLTIGTVNAPDEWALEICRAMGGDVYVNPPGGMDFFDNAKYASAGIDLQFLRSRLPAYVQRIGRFEPGLSVIDALMFCDRPAIANMLDEYDILRL